MSITGALSNALSGLNVTSRSIENSSNNVANALTEGFARRELEVTARSYGGGGQGVRTVGIDRMVNMALVADRRLADAATGDRDTRAAFYQALADATGDTGGGSLLARISAFSASLVTAASRPESQARLQDVLDKAQSLAAGLRAASDAVLEARRAADASIADQIKTLTATLARVQQMNATITEMRVNGRDSSAVEDERQRLVDGISTIVPVREVTRQNGQIALFTAGGAALLDGRVADIAFEPEPGLVAASSVAAGDLGLLTVNGLPLDLAGDGGMMGTGSLSAAFAVRDDLAPAEQARLDALAQDLIGRMAAADASLGAGDAGLFTDDGAAFDPAAPAGLASRLSVNALADPDRGGALWHLRDGLQRPSEGDSGDPTLLNALAAALDARTPHAANGLSGTFSFSGLAAETISGAAVALVSAEAEASFASARRDELQALILADGVDTDREMEQLLLLERAYAANAKVVTACDDLLQYLLEM
ncbi:flagellar hook-associated protein FlgK [Cereibacter sphaeroides]|uniref:flagellar hook-associated protein FlgK n=1 Tax=Cereibacter sphaeroides TaxID=1063 RepID=UPI003FCCDBF8